MSDTNRVVGDLFSSMLSLSSVVEDVVNDELTELTEQFGKEAGEALAKFAEERGHSREWISKKARDELYRHTTQNALRALNRALDLPADYYG